MERNDITKYSTLELLNELHNRRLWFYCWSPETISSDYWAAGIEQPSEDERIELCERIRDEIDEGFFDMTQALLHQLRLEGAE